jgi:hypothetical protein
MQKLPLSIQNFENLRTQKCVYVDKTEFVHAIADTYGAYFLARPRRFGKSLFLSTLKSLFEGKKELFEGLWIENKWDWTRRNPIIYLSFLQMGYQGVGLEQAIFEELKNVGKQYNIALEATNLKSFFKNLIHALYEKHGKIVLLIDEYDKPIIDYLENEDLEEARKNQRIMKTFYSVLKDSEAYFYLTFITGVSKFTKVSLFSDLNHLIDLTVDKTVSQAFGYTQAEIEHFFEERLTNFLENNKKNYTKESLMLKIKEWYNGYSWDGESRLYNPFGFLNFLHHQDFRNFWFSSGTPTFLINRMLREDYFKLENIETTFSFLDQYSLENVEITSLLFQTGYLTIRELQEDGALVLDYPNREVRESMYQFLMKDLGHRREAGLITVKHLHQAFQKNDLEQVEEILQNVFADLPYDVYTRQTEGLYHGLIHILFKCLGIRIESEVHTARGRADAIVTTATHIYIFEFKQHKTATEAMTQLKNRNYAAKYRATQKIIVGIGVNFDKALREFEPWLIENL